jgi:hypothetical protein
VEAFCGTYVPFMPMKSEGHESRPATASCSTAPLRIVLTDTCSTLTVATLSIVTLDGTMRGGIMRDGSSVARSTCALALIGRATVRLPVGRRTLAAVRLPRPGRPGHAAVCS